MSLSSGWQDLYERKKRKKAEEEGEVCRGNCKKDIEVFWVPVSSARQTDTNKKNRPKATDLIRERPREKKGWRTHTSLLSCLPWDRRRRRREEWRKGEGGGVGKQWGVWRQTQGPGAALHPTFILPLLIAHTGTKESTQEGFPMARTEARDRTERDRGMVESGRLTKKEREHFSLSRGANDALVSKVRGNRGAIVLYLSHPFLMRTAEGGGQVGT